jgi:tRNA pseudouridine55 synthase
MNQPKIERRDVDGVVLLDKPQGMTSNQALQVVKRLFRARKAGHTGSLDPLATGLLPICLGEATKVSAYLLDADKHYRTTGELGTTTRTGDAEGEVLEHRPVEGVDAAAVEAVLAGFRGEIEQVPPMYSALKQDGRRLYELARKGVEVERAPRRVAIHHLELLRMDGQQMELDVRCSKGTYIRTLVEDIGARLGCGAHVTALRRVGVSPYDQPRMWTLDALRALAEAGDAALDEALTPLDAALVHWPAVHLDADSAWYLCQGQAVWVPGAPTSGHLRLYGADGAFLGVGKVLDDGRVAPKRLLRTAA